MTTGKDPAAVRWGRRAGRASAAKRTPEERRELARKGAAARWTAHQYSTKTGAAYQRARRARLKAAAEEVSCACGEVTGVRCEWTGGKSETVMLEYEGAGGPVQIRCARVCAERLVGPEPGPDAILPDRQVYS